LLGGSRDSENGADGERVGPSNRFGTASIETLKNPDGSRAMTGSKGTGYLRTPGYESRGEKI